MFVWHRGKGKDRASMCACAITCLLIKNLGKSLDYDWQEWLDIEEGGMGKWWRRQVDEETRREQSTPFRALVRGGKVAL